MEKLSGLVIDAGDDYNGAVLRSIFPTQESVPDLIKNAEHLPPERRAELPDDLYALVLQDGDVELRKFACSDAGNTALSVEYFMKTADKLPVVAQKTAAANLVKACGWYGIEPPEELEKIALGLARAAHLALVGPEAVKSTKAGIQRNLAQARQSGSMVNPNVLGGKPPVTGTG
jgi:hypothetical protein